MFSLYFSSEFLFTFRIGRKERETDYAPDANSRPAVQVGSYAERAFRVVTRSSIRQAPVPY